MSESILIVEDQFLEANNLQIILEKSGHSIAGVARSVEQAKKLFLEKKPKIVLIDIFLKGKLTGIDLAKWLANFNTPFIYLSANSNPSTLNAAKATQPYGFLVKPFRERDILVALEIAEFRHKHSREVRQRQEKWLRDLLTDIIGQQASTEHRLLLLTKAFQPFIQFDYILIDTNMGSKSPDTFYGFQRIDYEEYRRLDNHLFFGQKHNFNNNPGEIEQVPVTNAGIAFYNGLDFIDTGFSQLVNEKFRDIHQVKSVLSVPVILENGIKSEILFLSRQPESFNNEHLEILKPLLPSLVQVIESISLLVADTDRDVRQEKTTLPDGKPAFPGIVGKSRTLLSVLDQVRQVAPYDTSVLILGETGSGKEGLVEAIHELSPRKSKPMIKINCAAIPDTLVESELFGHEKGSYTDAGERRIGKFEQAQGGTIFLDEIGEIPLDVQSKLLRVLQEKEIERVGGRSIIKVDVRIIAATNRNLYREVAEGKFRMDLYYRINVFPILLPPLRERTEDIPALAEHFLNFFAAQSQRPVKAISPSAMQQLSGYSWPGNIRELQHLIERHVLISRGTTIEAFELPEDNNLLDADESFGQTFNQTIEEVEKAHILRVLKKCNGKISGAGGAAEILRIPPSSLSVKMKKLGISWQHSFR